MDDASGQLSYLQTWKFTIDSKLQQHHVSA